MSDYNVVLLIEQALSALDARQVRGLHEEIEDTVVYHVLLPVEDAATRIESAMGTLAAGEVLASPAVVVGDMHIDEIQKDLLDHARADLAATVKVLEDAGAKAVGDVNTIDPIDGLAAKVTEVDAQEAIILTRSHVVAEFFHVDWTSRARRKIGVPCLHLLEHENFDEQAGEGEGISGL